MEHLSLVQGHPGESEPRRQLSVLSCSKAFTWAGHLLPEPGCCVETRKAKIPALPAVARLMDGSVPRELSGLVTVRDPNPDVKNLQSAGTHL